MAKIKNDYFKMLEEQIGFAVNAAELMEDIMGDFKAENVEEYRQKMHVIERDADDFLYDMKQKLLAEFITPIDQEDILHLAQIIDDITDALDEVVLKAYMYHIDNMAPEAVEMSKIVNKCVKAVKDAVTEFRNYKKAEPLHTLLHEVTKYEEEADVVIRESMHKLFARENDFKMLIGNKSVLESFEECSNTCEHAAKVMEQIIIKNT